MTDPEFVVLNIVVADLHAARVPDDDQGVAVRACHQTLGRGPESAGRAAEGRPGVVPEHIM
jgi:hypothetical protein